jgi:hypothetical protein
MWTYRNLLRESTSLQTMTSADLIRSGTPFTFASRCHKDNHALFHTPKPRTCTSSDLGPRQALENQRVSNRWQETPALEPKNGIVMFSTKK